MEGPLNLQVEVEWGVYCENFVVIGLTADAGDHFKNRAAIPLAPCRVLEEALDFPLFKPFLYGEEKGSLVSGITNIRMYIQAILQSQCLKGGIRTVTISEICVSKITDCKSHLFKKCFLDYFVFFLPCEVLFPLSENVTNFIKLFSSEFFMYYVQADSASTCAHFTLRLKGGLLSGY